MKTFLLILSCFFVLQWTPVHAKTLDAATSQAGVASTDNRVEKSLKAGGGWVVCQVGDVLRAGDKLRTAQDSSASLLLADHSVMRLGPNTEILIVDLTEQEDGCLVRRFQLSLGRVFSDVTPSAGKPSIYEVKGPNAVAAVRGTAFDMDTAEVGSTDVKVWDGTVEVKGQQEGAKSEMVRGDGAENHLRVNQEGRYQRLRFLRDHADAWQVENLETRKRWRALAATMPARVQLNAANMRQFNQVRHRLTPQQKQFIQRRLEQFRRNHRPNNPGNHRPHRNQPGHHDH